MTGSPGRYLARKVRALGRAMVSRTYRHQLLARLGITKGVFQLDTMTFQDRYPVIFDFVRSALGGGCEGHILSFGCSTGEEVFSLRTYFPRARIKGIDFNPGNVAECRRRLRARPDPGLSFQVAMSTEGETSGSYDAIFCMAVLRRSALSMPGVERCDHQLRFEDFARVIADFERCLKPGGLLAVRHSNFYVADTPSADRFEIALVEPNLVVAPVFGPDHRLIKGARNHEAVFRKR